jgi:hypothetical protein
MINSETFEEEEFAAHLAFWGRTAELQTLRKHLLSTPPHHCAIIGEASFGRTMLLRFLTDSQYDAMSEYQDLRDRFAFVYLDCNLYTSLATMFYGKRDYVSAQFWWDLYIATLQVLMPDAIPEISRPEWKSDAKESGEDKAYEIKNELETLIWERGRHVVIILDNFEGVARLPLQDSEWLRSLTQRLCTYIVSSRYRLYLLYHPEGAGALDNNNHPRRITTSPLWNLFSDPIYIGLAAETDVQVFLWRAYQLAKAAGRFWTVEDIEAVRKFAGCHPQLLRIACSRLFEWRLQKNKGRSDDFLWSTISREAASICQQLWQSLNDQELYDEIRLAQTPAERMAGHFSLPQKELAEIAQGNVCTESNITFVLEQRGLIEWVDGCWRVFSGAMQQYVLKQVETYTYSVTSSEPDMPLHSFSKLESQVYGYLLENVGKICSKEDIKTAVWQGKKNVPGDSALQKIIERIREKIESNMEQAQYLLIAVRGQGYMLRQAA